MGKCSFSFFESLSGAKASFDSFAVRIRAKTQCGRRDALGPLVGEAQVVKGKAGGFGGVFRWRVLIIALSRTELVQCSEHG